LFADLGKALVDGFYTDINQALVNFKLGFTDTAHTDAAFLAIKVGPASNQSGN
jgi:hypothetical protein